MRDQACPFFQVHYCGLLSPDLIHRGIDFVINQGCCDRWPRLPLAPDTPRCNLRHAGNDVVSAELDEALLALIPETVAL